MKHKYSKNQKILSQIVRMTESEKRDHHPTLPLPPRLQPLFFTFTMLWMRPAQNGVDLVEASDCSCSFFLEDRVVKPLFWLIRIKKVVLCVSCHSQLFLDASVISSSKINPLH